MTEVLRSAAMPRSTVRRKARWQRQAGRIFVAAIRQVFFLLLIVWSLVPILFIVISSFKRQTEIFAYPPSLFFEPTLQHYISLWTSWDAFFPTMINSAIISVSATALTCVICLMSGFVYSRYSSAFLGLSAVYLIAIRLLPPIVITLPLFPVVNALGLSDTHMVLVLLYTAFWVSICTMIMKTFIDEIPRSIDEAAAVDGASTLQLLWRVVAPMALQGLAACAIFVFVFSWNEYLFALIFTTTDAKTTPLIIAEVMDTPAGTNWGVLFAGVTIQLIPSTLLVVLTQRYLIAGLTAGSVKG